MTRAHQFHSRQGNTPHLEDLLSSTRLGEADFGGYYRPWEDICSLQHVYNSIDWLRQRSPAHHQGPSMLTEAHQRSVLTAAYRQVYHLFGLCAP